MKIIENVRPDRQTLMFSATFPRSVEMAARRILTRPIEITVGGRSVVCGDVEQHVEVPFSVCLISWHCTFLHATIVSCHEPARLYTKETSSSAS